MKVLLIPSWYSDHPTDHNGVLLRNYAAMYAQLGIRADILHAGIKFRGSRRWRSIAWRKLAYFEEDGVPVFRYHNYGPPLRSYGLAQAWLRRAMKGVSSYLRSRGKPDAIHAHGYMAALLAKEISDSLHMPFLYTEHSSAFLRNAIPRWAATITKKVSRTAGAVIAVSPGLADALAAITEEKIQVIGNPVDPDLFYPQESGIRNPFDSFPIGSPASTKGMENLLRAFSRLHTQTDRQVELWLGDDIAGKEELDRLAFQLKIKDKLHYTGSISNGEVASLMRKTDLYLSASQYETFGMTMLEALVSGVPVVATDTCGAKTLVNDKNGWIVPKGDVLALQEAMQQFLQGHRKGDGSGIRSTVIPKFSMQTIGKQYIDLIRIL